MSPTIPVDPQGRIASAYLTWTDASGAVQTFVPDLVISEEWSGPATITENPVEVGANVTDNIRVELRRVTLKIFATNEPIQGNQWTNAAFEDVTLELPHRTFAAPNGLYAVPEWESNLEQRVLIQGQAAGAFGATGLAVANELTNALLRGRVIEVPVQTDAGLRPSPAPPPVTARVLGFDNEDDFVLLTIQLLEALKSAGQTIDVFGTKQSCIGTTMGVGGMAIDALTTVQGEDEGTGATITIGLKEIRVVSTQTVPAPAPSLPRAAASVNKGNQQTSPLGDAAAEIANSAAAGFKQGSIDAAEIFGGTPAP